MDTGPGAIASDEEFLVLDASMMSNVGVSSMEVPGAVISGEIVCDEVFLSVL